MELSDVERYAVASLFTLALHSTAYDAGNATADAWGEPEAVQRDPRLIPELGESELEAWWGYDLVAPGGLLDRIYRELQLPPTKWRGLKLLPGAAPSASDDTFRQMVRGLIDMLDPELAAALPPLLPRRATSRTASGGGGAGGEGPTSPGSAEKRRAVGSLFDGLINSDSEDESDEDWKADLEREQKLQASAERRLPHHQAPLQRRVSREAEELVRLSRRLSLQSDASADGAATQQAGAGDGGAEERPQQPGDGQQPAGGQQEEPAVTQQQRRPGSAEVPPSPKAMGAVWELVQCCVGATPLPPDMGDPLVPQHKIPRPAVRWYDARARVALLQVAAWLQVPPRKVANLELLLTQDKAPRHKALSGLEEDAWSRRMRYFKVGAAAVGGGALFAVTGGLAAPAIAAGMGSILGFIGAPTALAGTVTGFLASTAGAATVTTTMAASGAASTGSKMAYRTAEISEFGFKELLPQAKPAPAQPPPPAPPPAQLSAQQHAGLQPPAGGSAELQAAAAGAAAAAAAAAAGKAGAVGRSGDIGHLDVQAAGGYHSARAQALRRASSSLVRAGSASSLASSTGSGGCGAAPAPAAQQGAAAPPPAEQAPSAWQRWFGGGGKEKEKEDLLLPVPMRVKQSGDVKLSVTIFVSGWISSKEDFEATWAGCVPADGDADTFSLVWETKALLHLNSALGKLLTMQAAGQSLQLATHSFLYAGAGLVAALGPTVLLGTASGLLISNAWAVASDRAVKAGKLLAHLLLSGAHGDRPVRLVAHGMGARLAFHCLLELCRQGARGVVQHAVLMGAPVGTEELRWRMARRAVAGRLVNCFTRKDWLLGVMAGGSTGWMRATAGLVPIEVPGVENANLTNLVEGHFAYLEELPMIMDMLMLG